MSFQAASEKSPTADLMDHVISFVGGTAAVTKVAGTAQGVTVTYVSAGLVNLVWKDNPGLFLGALPGLQATVPAGLKQYAVVFGVFNTTTFTLPVNIYNAAGTLTDLAALQWLTANVKFKMSNSAV